MDEPTVTDFDPAGTNAIYSQFAPAWRMCRDFAEMHEHILRDGTYLDRFGAGTGTLESQSQYDWRKQASFAIDYCSDLIDLRVGNIFRTSPVRTFDQSPWADFIARFLADVDCGGTGMDAFMTDVLGKYYSTGVDIIVDKTASDPDAALTRAHEHNMGMRPYLTAMTPLQRLDWECDHAGKYLWARYDMGRLPAGDEDAPAGARQFLTLTSGQWRHYTVDDDGSVMVNTGDMPLGRVPIVRLYYQNSTRPECRGVPLSLLTRIAPVARALLNLVSQGQLDIYMAIGVLAAVGVDADKLPREMAPMCWLALPEGASVQHIRPVVEHVQEKRQWIKMCLEAILRMGKLTGPSMEFGSRASSGLQVAVERTDLDNEMSATAGQLEQAEKDIIRLAVSRMEGRLVGHDEIGYTVEYNRRYVLTSASDIVAQAREFFDAGLGDQVPEMSGVFLRRVLDSILTRDDPRYGRIAKAINEVKPT